jgi:hypothetical protein
MMVEKYKLGWCLSSLDFNSSKQIIEKVFHDWNFDTSLVYRQRTRDFVMKDRDVHKYKELYCRIFSEKTIDNLG